MDKEAKEALFQFKRSIAINYEMGTTSINNERNIIIVKYIDDLEQRIDKAVEYIERRNFDTAEILVDMGSEYTYDYDFKEELLDILKGDNNE